MSSLLDSSQIHESLKHLQFIDYLHVSGFSLLVFEHFITIDSEIKYVWGSHWGLMKILYLLTRYLPFTDTSLFIFRHFLPHLSSHNCLHIFRATTWFVMVGLSIAEVIFTLRTWVMCGKKKWLTFSLPVFFVVSWTSNYYLAGKATDTVTFNYQPHMPRGCLVTGGDMTLIWTNWTLLFVYDFANLALMLIPAIQIFKQKGKSRMTRAIFTDGIIYYIYLFIVSLANLIVVVALSPDYFDIILAIGRIIHSILACRVVLHAREVGYSQSIGVTAS
ncbi:hypothetical protein BDQ17DRAFT_1544610 [Cyathus striatus]|nr:hypothetical protein BDQ17DRAFT_1544610 [Cyathus striatus]